ncbi:hypothetical protein [Reichenbachiella sp.]
MKTTLLIIGLLALSAFSMITVTCLALMSPFLFINLLNEPKKYYHV